MTPDAARAMYRRQMANHGTLKLRRIGAAGTVAEVTVRGRVMSYAPVEMIGDIQQTDRRVILLAEDIGSFPLPIQAKGADRIVDGASVMTIQAVDDRTRRVGGEIIAIELRVRG